MAVHLQELGLPFQREYKYAPGRRLRADFAVPRHRLLIEIVGGIFTYQAHGAVKGVLADIDRLNAATLARWRLLRATPAMVADGTAKELVARAVGRPV